MRGYRIGVPMHELPGTTFASKGARDAQIEGGQGITAADLGFPSLKLENRCQIRAGIRRDCLEAADLAIPEPR